MKILVCICLLLQWAACASFAFAAEGDEPDIPIYVPPASPLEAYEKARDELESTVDGYFHAALRLHIAVSDERLHELDALLQEQARLARESDLPGLFTERELVVRAKITILGQLDDRFASGELPADLEQLLTAYYQRRNSVVDLLIEGGAL